MKRWVKDICVKVAFDSPYQVFQHGAVIERGGKIIAKGVNTYKLHAPRLPHKYSTHAEAAAITRAKVKGGNIYVARVTRGRVRNSRPCNACMQLIQAGGIRKVFYSIAQDEWGTLYL